MSTGEDLDEDVHELRLGKEFDNGAALPISNAEVAIIMTNYKNNERENGRDVSDVFERTLSVCQRFSGMKDPVGNKAKIIELRAQLENMIFNCENQDGTFEDVKLEPYEVTALSNLTPDSVEEATSLIPSLGARFDEDDLGKVIATLIRYNQG